MGVGWQTAAPKSAADVAAMRARANKQAALASTEMPQLRITEVPLPIEGEAPPVPSPVLAGLKNDFGLINDDIKRSEFKVNDPSTWVDTREDDARIAARDSYKEAADNFQSLFLDPNASDAQRRQAQDTLTRARNAFNQARGVTEVAASNADYLTPLKEGIQVAQDALRSATERAADRIENSGLPPAAVAAATFPLYFAEGVASFPATLASGVVTAADGIAGTIAHPVDAGWGLLDLAARANETTPEGQAIQFLAEVAFGRFNSFEEAGPRLATPLRPPRPDAREGRPRQRRGPSDVRRIHPPSPAGQVRRRHRGRPRRKRRHRLRSRNHQDRPRGHRRPHRRWRRRRPAGCPRRRSRPRGHRDRRSEQGARP